LKKEVTERLKGLGLPAAEHCIVVSIDQQKLWFFEGAHCETFVISTARAGRGCVEDSQQTPDGLHRVAEKVGDGAAPGMVFKARQPTGKLSAEWPTPEDNLITSRILWLEAWSRVTTKVPMRPAGSSIRIAAMSTSTGPIRPTSWANRTAMVASCFRTKMSSVCTDASPRARRS